MTNPIRPTLFIIRGLSGSGKTTLGNMIADIVISADDYFMVDGKYRFNKESLKDAHEDCRKRVRSELMEGTRRIAVANVFAKYAQYEPYVEMAKDHGYHYYIIDLYNQRLSDKELEERNEHGLTVQQISGQRYGYQGTGRMGHILEEK